MVAGLFQVEANAQRGKIVHLRANAQRQIRPVHKFNRALGLWAGSGYHYQNPGPQGGYYNPYTAHNSGLITQGYFPTHQVMMSQSPNIGTSVVIPPPADEAFPPAPIGGSYESFDTGEDFENLEEAKSQGVRENLNTPDSEPEEKDGFDFDKENDVFDKKMNIDADGEKTMLHDLPRESNVDFELPQDALDFTLHEN